MVSLRYTADPGGVFFRATTAGHYLLVIEVGGSLPLILGWINW
jgi:hypothetical protein